MLQVQLLRLQHGLSMTLNHDQRASSSRRIKTSQYANEKLPRVQLQYSSVRVSQTAWSSCSKNVLFSSSNSLKSAHRSSLEGERFMNRTKLSNSWTVHFSTSFNFSSHCSAPLLTADNFGVESIVTRAPRSFCTVLKRLLDEISIHFSMMMPTGSGPLYCW